MSNFPIVARRAARQHGAVSIAQLDIDGVPPTTRKRWVRLGLLHRVHRGVVAVGHPHLSFPGRCMAAVLAAGAGAVVTGAAAACLRGAIGREPRVIDVIAPSGDRRRPRGVRVRSSARVPRDDRGTVRSIPVASPALMLFDLAATYTVTQLAAVMHELEFLGLLDLDRLESTMRRHRNRPGPNHRRCRQALILHRSGSAGTQSALERRAADSLLEHGAPMPEVTPAFRFGSKVRRPDLLFRDHHLAVEVDGSAVHGRSRTRNDDRIKQEQFASIGIDTLRIHEDTFDADVACVLAHLQTRELPRSRAVSGP